MSADNATIQYWTELADYDIEVAKSLHEKGHYLYVGFMCHQSVEKMLKALYVKQNSDAPPLIHKLDRLISMAGLEGSLSEAQLDLIDELTPLNIQARYPAYKDAIYKLLDAEKTEQLLSSTREFVAWLKARTS